MFRHYCFFLYYQNMLPRVAEVFRATDADLQTAKFASGMFRAFSYRLVPNLSINYA